jgi:hypothetical protein
MARKDKPSKGVRSSLLPPASPLEAGAREASAHVAGDLVGDGAATVGHGFGRDGVHAEQGIFLTYGVAIIAQLHPALVHAEAADNGGSICH